jgi:hypothetical protein
MAAIDGQAQMDADFPFDRRAEIRIIREAPRKTDFVEIRHPQALQDR